MAWFPFFVDLEGVPGLIVGGGGVALRKTRKLLPFGPRLTVAAPEFLPEFSALPGITLVRRPFGPELLDGAAFVITASDDREVNRRITRLCRTRGIPVNAADSREESTFLFPALLQRGSLTVGISTGGESPAAAACLRERFEESLPDQLEGILNDLSIRRGQIQKQVPDARRRAALIWALTRASLELGRPLTEEEAALILRGEEKEEP